MAIDDKLFRIFEEALATHHKSKAELARAVAKKQLAEFSYQRNGELHHHTWGTIMEYASLLVDYNLLDSDLKPVIKVTRVSRRGFDQTLGENVEAFADKNGFSAERIRDTVRELIRREPAQLPTPPTVCTALQTGVKYTVFQRAMTVRAFLQRIGFESKLKNVILVPGILRE